MKSGVYRIVQLSTGKQYVGSAKVLTLRWNKHRSDLRLGKHHSTKLQNSWNKYGESDFRFDIIEYCEESQLVSREQFWLDEIRPFFNILQVAHSAMGAKHTSESIAKMKRPRLDLTGRRFGRLIALEVSGRNSSGHYMWRCVCDCGNEKNIGVSKLSTGHTVSCGCFRKETAAIQGAKFRLRRKEVKYEVE